MQIQSVQRRAHAGFSMIEVMIAVLVLAVGLLALVGLQANLVRSAADAKARSRIAALVSSKMDEARAGGYGAIATDEDVAFECTADNDVCKAQEEAAVTGLSLNQGAVTTADINKAEYKTLTVTATWSDVAGTERELAMVSAVSPLSLDATNTLLNQKLSGDAAKVPVVRTDNPATAGVVPIAMGNGSSSAASNPTPEQVGRQGNEVIVGTKFNVLTYIPAGTTAVIQKRIETEVIKCSCQYGAGGTNLGEIYRTAQWPAIWTGERYDVYEPNPVIAAPGQSLSAGPKSGVVQSALCQECCRDHHDTNTTGVPKFDPERTGSTAKHVLDGSDALVVVTDTTNGSYLNACRIVRVDGFWRTGADLYSRQLGLLATEPDDPDKKGFPTSAATAAYTSFVKAYLQQYTGAVATAPANAQTTFDATTGLNDPTLVTIASASNTDFRYLHVRGLYVDYLEKDARAKLVQVLADTGTRGRCPTGTALADCVLPYLPFTSANLTEIAAWVASDSTVLDINSGNLLSVLENSPPSGGRTFGKKIGTADNIVSLRASNSGVAVNTALTKSNGITPVGGIDLTDDSTIGTDKQAFQVGSGATGDEFFVRISGGGLVPLVYFNLTTVSPNPADAGQCGKPDGAINFTCVTDSTLPLAGTVTVKNYFTETYPSRDPGGQCDSGGGTMVNTKGKANVPTFTNYSVTGAVIGATSGTNFTVVSNGKAIETTTVSFSAIPKDAIVTFTLATEGSPQYATATTCIVGHGGNTTITGWSKPWEQP